MTDDLFIPTDGDPLGDAPTVAPKRAPRSGSFAQIGWRAIASRANDDVYPAQITRFCLHLQACTRDGQRPGVVMNSSMLDLGISRRQKYRLLDKLEAAGRITVERRVGCHPAVTILRPWW
jgi:hypothetical protein